jgi:hypothetical protein
MTTTSIDEGKLEAFMGQAVTDMAHQRSSARPRDALARGLVDAARREPRPHWHLVRLVGGRNERRHRPDRRLLPDRDLQERVDRARRDRRQHAFARGAGLCVRRGEATGFHQLGERAVPDEDPSRRCARSRLAEPARSSRSHAGKATHLLAGDDRACDGALLDEQGVRSPMPTARARTSSGMRNPW